MRTFADLGARVIKLEIPPGAPGGDDMIGGRDHNRADYENLHRNMLARTDTDFATILIDLFALFAERTIQIASKRIWRYAEAASIRHPTTDLAREYATVDRELTSVIANIFDRYAIRLRSGDAPDSALLAEIFYDAWNTAFFRLIKSDDLTLDQLRADLRQRFEPLARMIFADDFLETPTLKIGHAAHGPS